MVKIIAAKILLLMFIFGLSISLQAQTADTLGKLIKNGSIEVMKEYISVKLALTNNVESFTVDDGIHSNEFVPNTSLATRFSFNYRVLSLSFSLAPKFIPGNDDDAIKGKTTNFGMSAGFTLSHWFTELAYNRTHGYYLENTSDYNPAWKPGDPYSQIPDLIVTSIEGATGYSFNTRFSPASLLTQTERQLKSAGSFIPLLSYKYYIVDDRSETGITQKSNNLQVLLGAGYHYNFVIKQKIYLYAGLTPSFGYIFTKLLTRFPTGYEHDHLKSPIFQLDGRVGAGYNGERFFGGGYITLTASSYEEQGSAVTVGDGKSFYQLFIGYRFRAPSFMTKTYDDVNKKVKNLTGM